MKNRVKVVILAISTVSFLGWGLVDILMPLSESGGMFASILDILIYGFFDLNLRLGFVFSVLSIVLSVLSFMLILYYINETKYLERYGSDKLSKIRKCAEYYFIVCLLFLIFYLALAIFVILFIIVNSGLGY